MNSEIRVYRHYRSRDWCPYQGIVHTQDDAQVEGHGRRVQLSDLLEAGLEDGDEIEITVRKTGRKLTTRWELTEPHTYAAVESPQSAGCPRCRKLNHGA